MHVLYHIFAASFFHSFFFIFSFYIFPSSVFSLLFRYGELKKHLQLIIDAQKELESLVPRSTRFSHRSNDPVTGSRGFEERKESQTGGLTTPSASGSTSSIALESPALATVFSHTSPSSDVEHVISHSAALGITPRTKSTLASSSVLATPSQREKLPPSFSATPPDEAGVSAHPDVSVNSSVEPRLSGSFGTVSGASSDGVSALSQSATESTLAPTESSTGPQSQSYAGDEENALTPASSVSSNEFCSPNSTHSAFSPERAHMHSQVTTPGASHVNLKSESVAFPFYSTVSPSPKAATSVEQPTSSGVISPNTRVNDVIKNSENEDNEENGDDEDEDEDDDDDDVRSRLSMTSAASSIGSLDSSASSVMSAMSAMSMNDIPTSFNTKAPFKITSNSEKNTKSVPEFSEVDMYSGNGKVSMTGRGYGQDHGPLPTPVLHAKALHPEFKVGKYIASSAATATAKAAGTDLDRVSEVAMEKATKGERGAKGSISSTAPASASTGSGSSASADMIANADSNLDMTTNGARLARIEQLSELLRRLELEFFALLDADLDRVNSHFKEISAELKRLEQEASYAALHIDTSDSNTNNTRTGALENGDHSTSPHDRVLSKFTALNEASDRLRSFVEVNYIAFVKILKKHDKITGHFTLGPYMNIVNRQAFYSLIDRAIPYTHSVGKSVTIRHLARDGNAHSLALELRTGVSVDAADRFGQTALLFASKNGHLECARMLLKATASANARDIYGMTPLIAASLSGHDLVLEELLRAGADPFAASLGDNRTGISFAAENGFTECVRRLLHAGASPNALDIHQRSPLFYACREGRDEVVELLLQQGADPTIVALDFESPLSVATVNNRMGSIRLLLDWFSTKREMLNRAIVSHQFSRPHTQSYDGEMIDDDSTTARLEDQDAVPPAAIEVDLVGAIRLRPDYNVLDENATHGDSSTSSTSPPKNAGERIECAVRDICHQLQSMVAPSLSLDGTLSTSSAPIHVASVNGKPKVLRSILHSLYDDIRCAFSVREIYISHTIFSPHGNERGRTDGNLIVSQPTRDQAHAQVVQETEAEVQKQLQKQLSRSVRQAEKEKAREEAARLKRKKGKKGGKKTKKEKKSENPTAIGVGGVDVAVIDQDTKARLATEALRLVSAAPDATGATSATTTLLSEDHDELLDDGEIALSSFSDDDNDDDGDDGNESAYDDDDNDDINDTDIDDKKNEIGTDYESPIRSSPRSSDDKDAEDENADAEENDEEVLHPLILRVLRVYLDFRDKFGCTPLHRTVEYTRIKALRLLLRFGANPDTTILESTHSSSSPLHGNSALILAAIKGDLISTQTLLTYHASPEIRGHEKATALLWASDRGHVAVVEALLSARADTAARNMFGQSALLRACVWNSGQWANEPVVRALIDAGSDVNARAFDGSTPLSIASFRGHLRCVEILLDSGAFPDVRDAAERTPLIRAAEMGNHGVVRLLINAGADVNAEDAQGRTPMICAAIGSFFEVVVLLLQAGADSTIQARNGKTAKDHALELGHTTMASLFSNNINNTNATFTSSADAYGDGFARAGSLVPGKASTSGLGLASLPMVSPAVTLSRMTTISSTRERDSRNRDVANALPKVIMLKPFEDCPGLRRSASVGDYNQLALELARAKLRVSSYLSKASLRASVKARSRGNEIESAGIESDKEIEKNGEEENIDGHVDTDGNTDADADDISTSTFMPPLGRAIFRRPGWKSSCAFIDIPDSFGQSALHLASREGRVRAVKTLIAEGANLETVTHFGSTALMCAARRGFLRIFSLLVGAGADLTKSDHLHSTVLHIAAQFGFADVIFYTLYRLQQIEDAVEMEIRGALHTAGISPSLFFGEEEESEKQSESEIKKFKPMTTSIDVETKNKLKKIDLPALVTQVKNRIQKELRMSALMSSNATAGLLTAMARDGNSIAGGSTSTSSTVNHSTSPHLSSYPHPHPPSQSQSQSQTQSQLQSPLSQTTPLSFLSLRTATNAGATTTGAIEGNEAPTHSVSTVGSTSSVPGVGKFDDLVSPMVGHVNPFRQVPKIVTSGMDEIKQRFDLTTAPTTIPPTSSGSSFFSLLDSGAVSKAFETQYGTLSTRPPMDKKENDKIQDQQQEQLGQHGQQEQVAVDDVVMSLPTIPQPTVAPSTTSSPVSESTSGSQKSVALDTSATSSMPHPHPRSLGPNTGSSLSILSSLDVSELSEEDALQRLRPLRFFRSFLDQPTTAGHTALMAACTASIDAPKRLRKASALCAKMLLKAGADAGPHAKDGNGKTALVLACEAGNYDMVRDLVQNGALSALHGTEGSSVNTTACKSTSGATVTCLGSGFSENAEGSARRDSNSNDVHIRHENGGSGNGGNNNGNSNNNNNGNNDRTNEKEHPSPPSYRQIAEMEAKKALGFASPILAEELSSAESVEAGRAISAAAAAALCITSGNSPAPASPTSPGKSTSQTHSSNDTTIVNTSKDAETHIDVETFSLSEKEKKKNSFDTDYNITDEKERKVVNPYFTTPLPSSWNILAMYHRLTSTRSSSHTVEFPNCDIPPASALVAACSSGFTSIASLLLKQGVCVDERSAFGFTPLMSACQNGHARVAALLLERGASVDALGGNGSTALALAAIKGYASIIALLLSAGATVNLRGESGSTALLFAAEKGNHECVRLLLGSGADPSIPNVHGHSPVIRSLYWNNNRWRNHETLSMLIAAGADLDAVAEHGNRAVHVAAYRGHYEALAMLLLAGADADAQNHEGATPLIRSSAWGNDTCVAVCLRLGKANPDLVDKAGRSAIWHAAALGRLDTVRFLLDAGARCNVPAFDGKTPKDVAMEKGFSQIVTLLQSAVAAEIASGLYSSGRDKGEKDKSKKEKPKIKKEKEGKERERESSETDKDNDSDKDNNSKDSQFLPASLSYAQMHVAPVPLTQVHSLPTSFVPSPVITMGASGAPVVALRPTSLTHLTHGLPSVPPTPAISVSEFVISPTDVLNIGTTPVNGVSSNGLTSQSALPIITEHPHTPYTSRTSGNDGNIAATHDFSLLHLLKSLRAESAYSILHANGIELPEDLFLLDDNDWRELVPQVGIRRRIQKWAMEQQE